MAVSWKRANLYIWVWAIYNLWPLLLKAVSIVTYIGCGFTIDL